MPQSKSDDTRLFDLYRPLPGVPDELVDAKGAMRPGWAGLVSHLSRRTSQQIAQDFARGDQHLADAGVFFRGYGAGTSSGRDWPFSPIPILLPEAEWAEIEAGLVQRADLLERVVADLYGAGDLVRDGHLPASLIARNPEWLRPMVGVKSKSGHFLHFVAFEIGRGPDGRWWVLSDRTDAPSGAGFALENRVATSRVFPELYRSSNVHRLAGFFRSFRDALDSLRGEGSTRAAILTPGPLTDTYFEQAYIARYLGLSLLEGGDLTVENGRVRVRTVQGLADLDVLWRRMDSVWADPLELKETSHLGTPGMMSALRQGSIAMFNALGVGVLETQALMAFLPAISLALTGKPLSLPNVATWWCGQKAELAHVRERAAKMLILPAMSTRMPYESGASDSELERPEADLDDWLTENASDLVAKELVKLSTTPVWSGGKLVPRPMTIRVFLARSADGWHAMPGGFGRIGATPDARAISMRNGGTVADVWIVSDKPVPTDSMLHSDAAPFKRANPGPLPSRAADNLFWLGRYVERTEGLLRLVRAYASRLDEATTEPLLKLLHARLAAYGIDPAEPLPQGIRDTLGSAVLSANQIRDRFSVDGWSALKDLEKSMARIAKTAKPGTDAAAVMGVMLRKVAGFSGLVHENMYRAAGWQFLTIGRSLERAAMMTELLAGMTAPDAPQGSLELAIEIGDSIMVHRQRYAVVTSRNTVIDLLALDDRNPRAVKFHLDAILKRVGDLASLRAPGHRSEFARKAYSLQTSFAAHSVKTLTPSALMVARDSIFDLSNALYRDFLN